MPSKAFEFASGGCYSSGSEHEPVVDSFVLAEMVNEFLEEQLMSCSHNQQHLDRAEDEEESRSESLERIESELSAVLHRQHQLPEAQKLLVDVLRAKDEAERLIPTPGPRLQRCIMSNLRAMGYNAAVCKSRWSASKGITEGEYAYIDVLLDSNKRFIVDTEFSMQFEIARPIEEYTFILRKIPTIFVGTSERLMLPPWRKPDYLRAKWFSAYKRTTNPLASAASSSSEVDCWQLPLVNPRSNNKQARGPGLAKLLTEAGLICQEQAAHQLVTVAM